MSKFLRFTKRNPIEDEYLYHVTYYGRLAPIAARGLRPGQPRSIGGEVYDSHRKRRVFLTEGGGVFFWHSRTEAFAEHNSDNVIEDGLVPVVLRVRRAMLEEDNDLELDEIGTSDSGGYESWMLVDNIILPEDIEVWNGRRWVSIDDWNSVDPTIALDEEEGESGDDDDGEDEGHVYDLVLFLGLLGLFCFAKAYTLATNDHDKHICVGACAIILCGIVIRLFEVPET
jgi:hypothetical protein